MEIKPQYKNSEGYGVSLYNMELSPANEKAREITKEKLRAKKEFEEKKVSLSELSTKNGKFSFSKLINKLRFQNGKNRKN